MHIKKLFASKKIVLLNICAIVLFFVSCATFGDYDFSKIDSNLSQGHYKEVQDELTTNTSLLYNSYDEVLQSLDSGVIYHFAGDYENSNKMLTSAEQLIDKYKATSITQSVTSFIVNDNYKDYPGEDFENIYSNILMSLNYISLGLYDDAMVEVRRFDNKIKELKRLYEQEVEACNRDSQENGVTVKKVSIKFSDSALARYLSMLLYRNDGDWDNAALDLKFANRDFSTQPTLYNFSVPKTLAEEKNVSKKDIRLNVIAFHGRAPVKKENVVRVYSGSVWYKLALPEMQKRNSQITHVKVDCVNKKTGKIFSRQLEKIESIENIAMDTFQQHYSLMLTKSLVRSITRAVTNGAFSTASDVANQNGNAGAALLFAAMDLFSKAHTEIAERADVRCSRYFPGNASVTGLTLDEPGEYEVTVSFMQGNSVLYRQTKTVNAKRGKLNLVESACLR